MSPAGYVDHGHRHQPGGTDAIPGLSLIVSNPSARAVLSTGMFLPTAATSLSFTAVPFDETRWDNGGMWSAGAPTRITPGQVGQYFFHAYVRFATSSTAGQRTVGIKRNGEPYPDGYIALQTWPVTTAAPAPYVQVTAVWNVQSVTDYFELYVFQDSGITLALGIPEEIEFTCIRLSSAPEETPAPTFVANAYDLAVLADNPTGYWPCEDFTGSVGLRDRSGFARSLLVTPTLLYEQPSAVLSGLAIDSNNSGRASRDSWQFATNNITLECWFYPRATPGASMVFLNNGADGVRGWGMFLSTGMKFKGICNSVAVLSDSTVTLSTNTWYHLVLVRDAGTWKYYVNGSLDLASAGTALPTTSSGSPFQIANTLGLFRISNVAIYDTALSAARVAAHYAAA